MKPYIAEILPEADEEAKEWAEDETELDVFPTECPFSIFQILDAEFLPE